MINTEAIYITIRATGKHKRKQVSWLLSDKADWFNDANPFLITDYNIGKKLYGDFSGKPVKVRMLSKYPYLKSRLEDYDEEQREADKTAPVGGDAPAEATETEATNKGGLEEKIGAFMNIDDMNADELAGYLTLKEVKFDKRKKKNHEYLLEIANTIK